jgi:hypothetical protein
MQTEEYFRSLSDECDTLKNRVRLLINAAHWPTDGEWKESVLRSKVRRSAPQSVTVGRGFVVSQDQCSSQIDLLVYDNTLPVVYKDGDLVFITPSSCRAIVEVKTSVSLSEFGKAATKLGNNAEFIRTRSLGPLFVGIFSYDVPTIGSDRTLAALQRAAAGDSNRLVDHACLGPSRFIKYWQNDPATTGRAAMRAYDAWHLYSLKRMAPGYFIHNLLVNVCRGVTARWEDTWFPRESKEVSLEASLSFVRA